MKEGTVKFFNESKGYGFIASEDGKDYFIHQTGLNDGVTIYENDEVSFEVEEGEMEEREERKYYLAEMKREEELYRDGGR